MTYQPEPIELLGVGIHPLHKDQLLEFLGQSATGEGLRCVCNVNAHALNLASQQPRFRDVLNSADLVFCDGFGVKLAARLLGHSLPERMTPPDWIDEFMQRLPAGCPVFLLGDSASVIEATQGRMRQRHPHLRFGSHHGFFDVNGDENRSVVEEVNRTEARVLLVGMGMPRQEYWIEDNRNNLKVSLAVPVGAMFRYYSGAEWRAPRWVTGLGLEWLTRLIARPRRMFTRYVVGLPTFLFRVLLHRMGQSWSR